LQDSGSSNLEFSMRSVCYCSSNTLFFLISQPILIKILIHISMALWFCFLFNNNIDWIEFVIFQPVAVFRMILLSCDLDILKGFLEQKIFICFVIFTG
jgi:hypothetical protein